MRTAWAACAKGTSAMLVRDRLDVLFEDGEFADLYPAAGRPGFSPGQLALVSVLQFAENLSGRAAADAVRSRIDFKYALGLELEDPGFDYSVLSEFRARLAEGDAADRLLRVMLKRLVEAGLLKAGGQQRTDAIHVLASVRRLSRLELAGESLRAALEELAEADEDWLRALIEPEWGKRYGRKVEIGKVPGGKAGVAALAETTAGTGRRSLPLPGPPTPCPGCGCCRRWRSCGRSGCTTTTGTRAAGCAGATVMRCPRRACGLIRRTTPMRTTASSGTPPGASTGCISQKRARQGCPRWWCTWPPRSPQSRTASSPRRSTTT
ncbi:transposase [Streptomyces sp. TRM70350]|uniref:transposase n=1 Tax=Streptomyces sp. TRM70350 TaxID=2856165 RepID=UPI001C450E3C|nr:transposase [Streptomyces sp. TRM70350]MBV7700789.1 transposase [Streptomyces sp. TRM70350]